MTIIWAVVLFGLLIFFHELGHFILAKLVGVKVLKFSLGFGPKIIGKKIGETEYLISAIPLGGYVKPLGEEIGEEIDEADKKRAFNYQPAWKRAAIVVAGPFFNLVLAFLIFTAFLGMNLPIAIPNLDSITTTIENVSEGSPAMEAGMKGNDTIVSINGSQVNDWNEMAEMFSKNPGNELHLKVRRDGKIIDVTVTPKPETVKNENGEDIVIGRIGISKKMDAKVIQSTGILSAPFKGLEAVYGWCALTLEVVVRLFSGAMSAKQIGGPILIVDAAAKAASVGAITYFNFIAIISINLAVLNLLPVPVLDGGHIMFITIEALRRKPLSERIMLAANRVGMALLLLLITFVFYNDIMRIVLPWVRKTFNI
ncbi:MAG: RIP metalloprotease RseP [Nitrospirota bacterium]